MSNEIERTEQEAQVRSLSDSDTLSRAQAARTLVNMKGAAAHTWPVISKLASDPNWMVRLQVVRATVHFRIPAEEALPILDVFREDNDEVVRSYANWAVEQISGTAWRRV